MCETVNLHHNFFTILSMKKDDINPNARYVRTSEALTSPIENELVMFDADAGKYYGFNEVATAIWNELEKPLTVDELCENLLETFEVEPEECRNDVVAFLKELIDKNLVEKV